MMVKSQQTSCFRAEISVEPNAAMRTEDNRDSAQHRYENTRHLERRCAGLLRPLGRGFRQVESWREAKPDVGDEYVDTRLV